LCFPFPWLHRQFWEDFRGFALSSIRRSPGSQMCDPPDSAPGTWKVDSLSPHNPPLVWLGPSVATGQGYNRLEPASSSSVGSELATSEAPDTFTCTEKLLPQTNFEEFWWLHKRKKSWKPGRAPSPPAYTPSPPPTTIIIPLPCCNRAPPNLILAEFA
jgi:hypothetical protein